MDFNSGGEKHQNSLTLAFYTDIKSLADIFNKTTKMWIRFDTLESLDCGLYVSAAPFLLYHLLD